MTTNTQHATYGSLTSAITLGTLANATNSSASSDIDNTTARSLWMDLVLTMSAQGSARTAGAFVFVYLLPSYDGGTTYARLNETTAEIVAAFPLDAATTAGVYAARNVEIPALHFKLFARNVTGQAFASTNDLSYLIHELENV